MNAGATAERVFHELRARILANSFRPGSRLDPTALAAELASSATPIREALHQLVGEGLVEPRTGAGFFLPLFDEPSVADRYRWSLEVLNLAMSCWERNHPTPPLPSSSTSSVVEQTEALFLAICHRSDNREHAREMSALNGRLRGLRMVEAALLDDVHAEIAAMCDAFVGGSLPQLRPLVRVYHQRRRKIAGLVLRALYRRTDAQTKSL